MKVVMTVTQHPKRVTSLRKKMRQTLTVGPEMTVKTQMPMALMRKILVVVVKLPMLMARTKTLMGKPMNPAVRLKSQVLKAAPALQNPMIKL